MSSELSEPLSVPDVKLGASGWTGGPVSIFMVKPALDDDRFPAISNTLYVMAIIPSAHDEEA